MHYFLTTLLFIMLSSTAIACEKCDIVIDVIDGDTVIVLCEGKKRPVHLVSVDAPQLEQPYGKEAKAFTKKLLLNNVVTIDYVDRSRANDMTSADGKSLKWGLIRAGLAWYPANHKSNSLRNISDKLGKHERKARRSRKGLWAQDKPVAPWSLHRNSEAMPEVMAKLGNRAYGKAKIPNGARVVG
jgi:endonuclease YncB( thermonuclease family)